MPHVLTTAVTSSLDWLSFDEKAELAQISDDGEISPSITMSSGTGLGNVNELWYASGTLTPNATFAFDLQALGFSSFNLTVHKLFNLVKILQINNLGTGIINVPNTGLPDSFNLFGPIMEVGREGVLHWYSPEGFVVTSGNRNLYLQNNNGFNVDYKVGIVGVFGTSSGRACGFGPGFSNGFCA